MRRNNKNLARRIDALPLTPGERDAALHYVRLGENIAEFLLGVARFFSHKPAPRAIPHH